VILAFFRKDVRLSARAGHLVPGLTTAIALQAIGLGLIGGWSLWSGAPIGPGVMPEIPRFLAVGAFLMAIIGPANASVMSMMPELQPDIAESLASAPIRATRFLAGKCLLPMLGGIGWQLALLPSWAFLLGRGLIDVTAPFKVLALTIPLAGFSALTGVSRWRTLQAMASGRLRGIGVRRGTPAQQIWIVFALMFATTNVITLLGGHALGPSVPAGSLWLRGVDLLRAFLPMAQLRDSMPVSMFGFAVPTLLVGPPLLLLGAAGTLARAVAGHPRALDRERRIAQMSSVGARSIVVLVLTGGLWVEGASAACAVAALVASIDAIVGIAGVKDRLANARAAAMTCVPAAAVSSVVGGVRVLLFWMGMAMLCAFFSGALPVPQRDRDRRPIAIGLLLMLAMLGPATVLLCGAILLPGSPLIVAGGLLCLLSPLVAIASLASSAISPLGAWTNLVTAAPMLASVPPWAICALVYGTVTAIASRRGTRTSSAPSTVRPAGG
jgi:hypothetical protein